MSIIHMELAGSRVLDLFAGSGALGIEALSRGAREAHFVELSARSLSALRANLSLLEAGDDAVVHRGDALRFVGKLRAGEFDIAFADPPYRLGLARRIADAWAATPFAQVIGIEHEKSADMPEGGDSRAYGDTVVTFYRSP